jgi:HlyD family secretion protein
MNTKTIVGVISIIIIGAMLSAILWKNPLTPAVNSHELVTTTVEIGNVIKSVPGKGIIEPENEVLLLSPAASIITEIVHGVGNRVEKGDVILKLDDEPIRDQIDQMQDQIEVNNNNLEKTILNARNTRIDLDYNVEVKRLSIISIKSELADQQQLLEVGGISPAKVEKTKQELTLAEKDLSTILTKNEIRLRQLAAEEKGLRLQIEMQQKQLNNLSELLNNMAIRASSDGIILEINGKVGEKVSTDRVMVRMSDLSTFKVRASIAETYGNIAKTGKIVLLNVDGKEFHGKVGTVTPSIRDGNIEFDVFLSESSNMSLRPNMTVELMLVVEQRDSVMRIKSGPALEKNQNLAYIKNDDMALLKELETGLIGDQYVEVRSGLSIGDTVIISDVSPFRKKSEVTLY